MIERPPIKWLNIVLGNVHKRKVGSLRWKYLRRILYSLNQYRRTLFDLYRIYRLQSPLRLLLKSSVHNSRITLNPYPTFNDVYDRVHQEDYWHPSLILSLCNSLNGSLSLGPDRVRFLKQVLVLYNLKKTFHSVPLINLKPPVLQR